MSRLCIKPSIPAFFFRRFIMALLLACICLPFAQAETKCVKGEIRSLQFGKWQQENLHYKIALNNDAHLLIQSCDLKKSQSGLKLKEAATVSIADIRQSGPYGNPSFRLCEMLRGEPQKIEVKRDEIWQTSDICRFADGSFVSTGLLMTKIHRK